jgi:hypothetical protein
VGVDVRGEKENTVHTQKKNAVLPHLDVASVGVGSKGRRGGSKALLLERLIPAERVGQGVYFLLGKLGRIKEVGGQLEG